jgi:hypothetical protein
MKDKTIIYPYAYFRKEYPVTINRIFVMFQKVVDLN